MLVNALSSNKEVVEESTFRIIYENLHHSTVKFVTKGTFNEDGELLSAVWLSNDFEFVVESKGSD